MADLIYDFHHQDKDVREVDIKTIERNVYEIFLSRQILKVHLVTCKRAENRGDANSATR